MRSRTAFLITIVLVAGALLFILYIDQQFFTVPIGLRLMRYQFGRPLSMEELKSLSANYGTVIALPSRLPSRFSLKGVYLLSENPDAQSFMVIALYSDEEIETVPTDDGLVGIVVDINERGAAKILMRVTVDSVYRNLDLFEQSLIQDYEETLASRGPNYPVRLTTIRGYKALAYDIRMVNVYGRLERAPSIVYWYEPGVQYYVYSSLPLRALLEVLGSLEELRLE